MAPKKKPIKKKTVKKTVKVKKLPKKSLKGQKIPRNKEKFPALNVRRMVSNRREYVDYDYIEGLDDKAKDFLNRFTEEYYIANFNHKGKSVDKTKKAKKDSYDRNNQRNRDLYSKAKVTGLMDNAPTKEYLQSKIDAEYIENAGDLEDILIDLLFKKPEE
jgi:hypothetical protein